MKKSPLEIYYQFEDTIPQLIKIFIKKNFNSLLLDSNNLNLKKTCEKFLYTTLHTSPTFFKLFEDIKENKYKKNYLLESYELKLLALELAKIYNLKGIIFIYKKNYLKKFFFFFKYTFIIAFFYFFKLKNNKKRAILCLSNDKKFEDKFTTILKKLDTKKKIFNLDVIIKELFFADKEFNFKWVFKNSLLQTRFFFMHQIYLSSYLYDYYISSFNSYFILFFEGDSPDHEIVSTIGNRDDIKTICIQWGSIMTKKPKPSFRNSGYNTLLVWSNHYKKIFNYYNNIPNIITMGNCFIKENKTKKNKILFLLPQQDNATSKKQMDTFIQIINWVTHKYPNEAMLRIHPNPQGLKKIKKYLPMSKLIIHDPKKNSLNKSFKNSYLIITLGSSCIFEAGKLGIIPIVIFDKCKNIWAENISKLNTEYKVKLVKNCNLKSIVDTIELVRNDKPFREQLSSKIKSNFNKEIYKIGEYAINNYTNFFKKLL